MSEIISDIVLAVSTFLAGLFLGYVFLAALEMVKDYLARRKLKAPNGKRTNLTAQQWFAVRTPLFKAWFGD